MWWQLFCFNIILLVKYTHTHTHVYILCWELPHLFLLTLIRLFDSYVENNYWIFLCGHPLSSSIVKYPNWLLKPFHFPPYCGTRVLGILPPSSYPRRAFVVILVPCSSSFHPVQSVTKTCSFQYPFLLVKLGSVSQHLQPILAIKEITPP